MAAPAGTWSRCAAPSRQRPARRTSVQLGIVASSARSPVLHGEGNFGLPGSAEVQAALDSTAPVASAPVSSLRACFLDYAAPCLLGVPAELSGGWQVSCTWLQAHSRPLIVSG